MSREIALLVNPTAGRGRGTRAADLVANRLSDAGVRVHRMQGRDAAEAATLARDAVEAGVETLAVVGGDGMVHLAAQVLAKRDTRLGIVPTGTGNDAARAFGVPRRDPLAAAEVLLAGRSRTVDLAHTGSAYVVCVLSAGFDAVVNERANRMRRPRGQLRYSLATLAELRVFEPICYDLDLDGETASLTAMLVAVGNGPSFGGGLRITEGARLDDGMLDVVVFHPVSKLDLVRTYPTLFRGTHVTHPAYEHHLARSVTIQAPGIVAYADGERLGPLPLTVSAEPRALQVLTGRDHDTGGAS